MAASTRLTLDDLVDAVLTQTEAKFAKKDIKLILQTVFAEVKNNVTESQDLRIHDFGIFSIKERAERIGRNPQTGKALTIPASSVLAFKPSKSAK